MGLYSSAFIVLIYKEGISTCLCAKIGYQVGCSPSVCSAWCRCAWPCLFFLQYQRWNTFSFYINSNPAASIVSGHGNKVAHCSVELLPKITSDERDKFSQALLLIPPTHIIVRHFAMSPKEADLQRRCFPLQLLGQHGSVGKGIQCNQSNKTEHWPEPWRINQKAAGAHSPTTSSNLLSDGRIQRNLRG